MSTLQKTYRLKEKCTRQLENSPKQLKMLSCQKPQGPTCICKNVIYTLNVQSTRPFKISSVKVFD